MGAFVRVMVINFYDKDGINSFIGVCLGADGPRTCMNKNDISTNGISWNRRRNIQWYSQKYVRNIAIDYPYNYNTIIIGILYWWMNVVNLHLVNGL